jgi:hypothetical protein
MGSVVTVDSLEALNLTEGVTIHVVAEAVTVLLVKPQRRGRARRRRALEAGPPVRRACHPAVIGLA